MIRYSEMTEKNQREIVYLKSSPFIWRKLTLCDYISDNSSDAASNNIKNKKVLKNVTGQFGALKVINSGSCFELSKDTLENIEELFFESHRFFRKKLHELENHFNVPIVFKCRTVTSDGTFGNEFFKIDFGVGGNEK